MRWQDIIPGRAAHATNYFFFARLYLVLYLDARGQGCEREAGEVGPDERRQADLKAKQSAGAPKACQTSEAAGLTL